MDECQWTLDDKLIRVLDQMRILSVPCKRCLVEVICRTVCEQCNSYNDKCNVIRKHLFNIVECGIMMFWITVFGGVLSLIFYMDYVM